MGTPFQTGKHLPEIMISSVILGVWIVYSSGCVSKMKREGGGKGGFMGRGGGGARAALWGALSKTRL